MTDQEINDAVASKLHWGGKSIKTHIDYCHSIEAAWEIVEHIRQRPNPKALINPSYAWEIHAKRKSWIVYMTGPTWKQMVSAEADTAPMAICLAFLKL